MIAPLSKLRKRRDAIRAIRNIGGAVGFRDDSHAGLTRLLSLPRLAFDMACSNAASVSLLTRNADDTTLRRIAPLTKTQHLAIFNSTVIDDGFQALRHWHNLASLLALDVPISTQAFTNARWIQGISVLCLSDTLVDDSIWPAIMQASQLVELGIGGTQVTNIRGLANHPHITSLDINSLPIQLEEVVTMPCAQGLSSLYVNDTPLTDASCRSLLNLPNIAVLAAGHTEITDAAMEHVATLSRLEELIINDSGVADDGIGLLSTLPKLRFLCISSTKATAAILETLSTFTSLDTVFLDAAILNPLSEDERQALPFEAVPIDDET